ncbi:MULTISPECIES: OmpH family outer membrane protein [Butyricimonas]|uniref:OmpH family outer membrane protein n=1 Tax=Butyricimonas TaxID=574697 RepID=UPI00036EDAEA|nr:MULTISPECIES: OmpH family outer membrane protein [Butyricimonas]
MKNTVKLFALVAFIFVAFAASAQTAKPIKLGHLDVQKLMSVMPESKKADETLQAKQTEIQKEMASMTETYQKLLQEYQANEKTYTDLVRANKEQEIRSLGERIQNFRELADQQLQETYNKLMGEIMEKIQKAAQEVGKENGFTYIFTMNALLFAADNSEDVLPLMKKKLGLQ